MKKINLLLMSLMALLMTCFTACENQYEVDHTAELVGTWTYIGPNYAEALVFNADGTVLSTGVEDGEYWENVAGTYVIKGNVVTMNFEDDDNVKGHIDVVPGIAFTVYEEDGENWTFNYCAEDLSEEIVGMWVCTYVSTNNEDFNVYQDAEMAINTYKADGKSIFTGLVIEANDYMANVESTYKVIGDLMLESNPLGEGVFQYNAFRLTYSPNSNQLGDMLTKTSVMAFGDEVIEFNASMVRVKEGLNLAGKGYYYHDVFVSNVDGVDQDIDFMGYTFNFAKMTNSELNKLLNSLLFNVEFPNANTIQYIYMYNNAKEVLEAPIAVEGNKLTVKMSANEPALKDVVFYAFQDADCSQLHFYMHKTAFVNFYTNMQAMLMAATDEQFDITNAEAVNAIYNEINNTVQSINVSLVMENAAK